MLSYHQDVSTCHPQVSKMVTQVCLLKSVWWDSHPSSKLSVCERINKAQAAFFSHGQLGAFHGLINPLSSRSTCIVECCILPILMYSFESWVLNSTLLSSLESFQSELGKHISKLPKYTLNSIYPMNPMQQASLLKILINTYREDVQLYS